MKNDNLVRDAQRSLASKNSMWYDLNVCRLTWEECITNLVKRANNAKLCFEKRVVAFGILKASELLDKDTMVPLKDLFEVYSFECKKELLYNVLRQKGKFSEGEAERVINILPKFLKKRQNDSYYEGVSKHQIDLVFTFLKSLKEYKYHSPSCRDMFCRHLNVLQVYKRTENNNIQPFIIKRITGIDWALLVDSFDWPSKEALMRNDISKRLSPIIETALNTCSSKSRHILKFILTNLTSLEFMEKKGFGNRKFNRFYLKANIAESQNVISDWTKKKMQESQYKIHKQRLESGPRIPGSGRKYLAEKYPELITLMMTLFDAGGDGFQSHPRLICDTLFLQKSTWMNMPRCVSILQNVYDIPISLSAAYTYTENFRSGSFQARRHHEHKKVNPGISLKKSTRDGSQEMSINDHYAQADVNYSIEAVLLAHGKVLARDDKSLVHCDVEVVQRPSKSWKKVVYSDHDWEKDTKRSLQITTYQFVKVKNSLSDDKNYAYDLCSIPICQSRITGGGMSVVKLHFFEPSTVFRHVNELMFLMTLQENITFFKNETQIIPQLLLTVDGGPDERPRNKLTMFATVLLRKLLNIDKVKVISYAEGSSKRHSVERLHFAEGRSLSQGGTIASKSVHSDEKEDGLFSTEKFKENMNAARDNAIDRLNGTPYAREKISAVKPPPEEDWVISAGIVEKIQTFLKKDTTEHRLQNNFIISPNGPVWKDMCRIYDLHFKKSFSAISIFNEMYDPKSSWLQHYAFACYRPDDSWTSVPVRRYEIQPILDVSKLPDHKYLPYSEAEKITLHFEQNEMDMPCFLKIPDFYLPSKNIKHVLGKDPSLLMTETFINMIGVSSDNIRNYVKKEQEKLLDVEQKRLVKQKFKDRSIGHLLNAELKTILEHWNVSWTRQQNNRADLLNLVDQEQKKRNLKDDDVIHIIN